MAKPRITEARKALVDAYTKPGARKPLTRIPNHELAEFNATFLPEGIRLISNGKFQARYRAPDKTEVAQNFDTLGDAKDFRTIGLAAVARGEWDDPHAGKETVEHFYTIHLKNKAALKASSRDDIVDLWRRQVSAWSDYPVSKVTYAAVEDWVIALGEAQYSRSVVRRCALVLSGILEEAVKRGSIRKNPLDLKALGKVYPKASTHGPNPLTLEQLDLLIEHSSEHYRGFTEFIARTGLRISEARELRVQDVLCSGKSPSGINYSKHPVLVVSRASVRVPERDSQGEPVTNEDTGRTVYKEVVDTPKGGEPRRIPLTPRVLKIAKAAAAGKAGDELLFTNVRGGPVSKHGFGTSLSDAVERAQITTETRQPITPHSLRDTFATQALLSGASVIAVSRALGHKDPSVTLSRYAGLLPEDTETLRAGLTTAENKHTKTARTKRTYKPRRGQTADK